MITAEPSPAAVILSKDDAKKAVAIAKKMNSKIYIAEMNKNL